MLMSTISNLKPSVTAHIKFNPLKPKIDNFAFKLHYRVTVCILLFASVTVCAREYFGDHIMCIADKGVAENVIKTYCFFMATFTIVRHYNESLLESGFLPHPGVGPMSDSDETLHHTYYQWVPFVLFTQALCFYMPHYIWKSMEGGRIKKLVDGLQLSRIGWCNEDAMKVDGKDIPTRNDIDKKLDIISKDILLRLQITRTWSFWLVAMEVTNLLHVMLQIWMTDIFLNGMFFGLGSRILDTNWDMIADPLETVFPKMTKCIFHKFGPSGSIQQHDALCVMALNIIHEKIYSILWFWFLFLFIASVLAVVWRFITICLYRRPFFMKFNSSFWQGMVLPLFQKDTDQDTDSESKFYPHIVMVVVNGCQFGDWLFLHYLAKNMHKFVFQQLFERLAEELEKKEFGLPGFEKKGAEPVPLEYLKTDYDDETLPLKKSNSEAD